MYFIFFFISTTLHAIQVHGSTLKILIFNTDKIIIMQHLQYIPLCYYYVN